ncbi:hypothetical protein ACLQ2R_13310 [Streptosporangium sp. DT93]|uniref:hypothetical protein n=1 Tax=Streptosporangium sp. DT93 TaxID=3393428 RepID=UPI003CF4D85D
MTDADTRRETRTGEQVRDYLLAQLNATLRRPGMYGGETALRLFFDAMAFTDDREQAWREEQDSLRERGAFLSTGVRGAFESLWDAGTEDMVASVYAECAHRHGWLHLDRVLPRDEYDGLIGVGETWCEGDRTLGQILGMAGPPSLHCGGTNPYRPKTLVYATEHPRDPLLCLHFWNELLEPSTDRVALYDEPVLLAVRVGGADFADGFTFTPTGTNRRWET